MVEGNGKVVSVKKITVGKEGAMWSNSKLCFYFTSVTAESMRKTFLSKRESVSPFLIIEYIK